MSLEQGYLDVAEHSLETANACLKTDATEAVGFHSYHSFESLGGAFVTANGKDYPRRSHPKKINVFVTETNKGYISGRFRKSLHTLAIKLISLRNDCLYPLELADGSVRLPRQVLTESDARQVLKRVKGVDKDIRKLLE